jgi:hypothetical protein
MAAVCLRFIYLLYLSRLIPLPPLPSFKYITVTGHYLPYYTTIVRIALRGYTPVELLWSCLYIPVSRTGLVYAWHTGQPRARVKLQFLLLEGAKLRSILRCQIYI